MADPEAEDAVEVYLNSGQNPFDVCNELRESRFRDAAEQFAKRARRMALEQEELEAQVLEKMGAMEIDSELECGAAPYARNASFEDSIAALERSAKEAKLARERTRQRLREKVLGVSPQQTAPSSTGGSGQSGQGTSTASSANGSDIGDDEHEAGSGDEHEVGSDDEADSDAERSSDAKDSAEPERAAHETIEILSSSEEEEEEEEEEEDTATGPKPCREKSAIELFWERLREQHKAKAEQKRISLPHARLAAFRAEAKLWREQRAPPSVVDLKKPLDEEEEEIYNFGVYGDDGEPDPDTVLFERNNSKVTREQMLSLLPGTWLNDEVINQYLSLLRARSQELAELQSWRGPRLKCYFHLTFMYTKLMEDNKYDYARVRRWTKRGSRKCDLFDMDLVFFPRNVSNSHWTLCVARIKDKRIEYFDSMGGRGEDCMRNVLRYLADEHQDKKSSELDTADWELVSHGRAVPQQDNCNDCGVFVCTFCNYLSMGEELNFSAHDMPFFRQRIFVDLFRGETAFGRTSSSSS